MFQTMIKYMQSEECHGFKLQFLQTETGLYVRERLFIFVYPVNDQEDNFYLGLKS